MATEDHNNMRNRNGDSTKPHHQNSPGCLTPESTICRNNDGEALQEFDRSPQNIQKSSQHLEKAYSEEAWHTNGNDSFQNDSQSPTKGRLLHRPVSETPHMELIDEQIRAVDPLAMEVLRDEHPLEHAYTLWFSKKPAPKQIAPNKNFEDSLKILATFRSVERFWKYYTHLKFPHELHGHCDYHLFKYGIKPMWEDPANRDGGKWILRLRKCVASRVWENVILAILGEQFLVGDEICGAVMSVRYGQESIISVWNRTADDSSVRTKIMETLRRVANLPQHHSVEYKRHNKALIERRSYRNTEEPTPR